MNHRDTETQRVESNKAFAWDPFSEDRDPLTDRIIGCAIEVHRELGPGLLESAYTKCLGWELSSAGLSVQTEVPLPVVYKGHLLDCGYRIDILVENAVVLELKTVDKLLPVHEAQLLTYLKLSKKQRGLLLNFQVKLLREGIRRFVL